MDEVSPPAGQSGLEQSGTESQGPPPTRFPKGRTKRGAVARATGLMNAGTGRSIFAESAGESVQEL